MIKWYVKNTYLKESSFQNMFINSSKLHNNNEFNQYQRFTIENIHSYPIYNDFIVFKLKMIYTVTEEFFQIQNFSTKNDVDFYILGHLQTILANNSNQMCNLFVISNISHLINFVCQIHGRTTFVLNTLNPQRKSSLCKFLEHENKSWKYWTLIGCVEVAKNYFVSFSRNNTTKTYLATFLLSFFF